MSIHSVNVIEITEVRPHENAERLEIIPVGGWQAVVAKGQFKRGDHAVYIQPDYVVPTSRPEFKFLAKEGRDRHRLKAIRLRGALSFGLLIPIPQELMPIGVGANVMADLGIERYEPIVKTAKSDELPADQWPDVYASKFDIESLQNFPDLIKVGEDVIVTEKIHGANGKYMSYNGVFYMGSRTRWLKPDVAHIWRRAAEADTRIRAWCESHPGTILYGEVYGPVQSLKYGRNEPAFAAFAAMDNGEWMDTGLLHDADIPVVPLIYRGPYDPASVLPMAEGNSVASYADADMMEGIVIVPVQERMDENIGRVALKHISNRYWESAA